MIDIIIISDLHIGREDCNIHKLSDFLVENETKTLVLNGDVFDQFALWEDKGKLYRNEHKWFVKNLLKLLKSRKTKIIYLIGNHDYLMFLLMPFGFLFNIKIRKRIHLNEFLIEHGDWITFYLKIRKFLNLKKFLNKNIVISDDYHENCVTFAELKKKDIIVGHSHQPKKVSGPYADVYDVVYWVGNNTSLIIKNGKII